MSVSVMNIRVMWVFVRDLCMNVSMNMGLLAIPSKVVDMLMTHIVRMRMLMVYPSRYPYWMSAGVDAYTFHQSKV